MFSSAGHQQHRRSTAMTSLSTPGAVIGQLGVVPRERHVGRFALAGILLKVAQPRRHDPSSIPGMRRPEMLMTSAEATRERRKTTPGRRRPLERLRRSDKLDGHAPTKWGLD